jgi:hypothetical protein
VTTKVALWIVGGAAVALAVYYAFGAHKATAANSAGITSASPPPQPVGGTLLTSASFRGLGAFSPMGRQFLR